MKVKAAHVTSIHARLLDFFFSHHNAAPSLPEYLEIYLSAMVSTPVADPNCADKSPDTASNSADSVPTFGARVEELAKQYNEKIKEGEVILKSVKSLHSECDDIRAMFDTITDQGLFDTALQALKVHGKGGAANGK